MLAYLVCQHITGYLAARPVEMGQKALKGMRSMPLIIVLCMMAESVGAQEAREGLSIAEKQPLAPTPPMGWMSWERFRCETDCNAHPNACINEELYIEMAKLLVEDGYLAAGYDQISIDDCWESKTRDATGRLRPNATRFPSGIKALGDTIHALGARFGIYSDMGTHTCGGYPGSQGHEQIDAQTFAEWGVDYLKLDGCYNNQEGYVTGYPKMGRALEGSGRNITYSCSWPAYLGTNETAKNFSEFRRAGCHLWRNWDDISNTWESIVSIIDHWGDYSKVLQESGGPNSWNDMDMLIIGNDHYGKVLPSDNARAQMAIWSVCASPLFMSNDLRTVTDEYRQILLNPEVIAVNQDPMGIPGVRATPKGDQEVWIRRLFDGSTAVALLNKRSKDAKTEISVDLRTLGVNVPDKAKVRDLFERVDLPEITKGQLTAVVPREGVTFVKVY
ncbi:hypothetical protein AAMO2058_000116800 [Amorphochlora amoebiformis]